MHASFPYESNRTARDYGVRRPDVLIQSHPGLDGQDPLVLHGGLSGVDDPQVSTDHKDRPIEKPPHSFSFDKSTLYTLTVLGTCL